MNITLKWELALLINSTDLEETTTTFVFQKITVDYVYNKLVKLKTASKLDILDFDCKLLQFCAHYIAPQLTKLFNLSIEQGKNCQNAGRKLK